MTMKLYGFVSAAVLLTLASPVSAQPNVTVVPLPKLEVPVSVSDAEARAQTRGVSLQKIILVGDSTVQVGSGWGGAFCANHVAAFTPCINMALGGRSTLSYRAEGTWDIAMSEAKAQGFSKVYVIIQFGHNDQPGKPGQSTDLDAEFPQNLKQYVRDVRSAGAIPVLVTPVTRRNFVDYSLQDTLAPWADSTKRVAQDLQVPLVDLHKISVDLVQAMGPVASLDLSVAKPSQAVVEAAKTGTSIGAFKPGVVTAKPTEVVESAKSAPSETFDYTHLGRQGAALFSAEFAKALILAVPELKGQIKP